MKWQRFKKSPTGDATGDPIKGPVRTPIEPESRERNPRSLSQGELRVLWRDSSDYASFKKRRRKGAWMALSVAVLGGGAWYYFTQGLYPYTDSNTHVMEVVASFALGAAVLYGYALLMLLLEQQARRQFTDRIRFGLVDALQRDEQKIADEAADGQLDLPSLWAATQRRIDVYHEIATSQAASSFKIGQWAMVAGFGVVVLLGIVAAFAKDGTASVAASVAGVAGAAMGAYIGSTFMKAQAEASAQLSQFFLQPVEFARLLGAERLLETLDKSERTVAVQQVIEAMMIAPAQHREPKKDVKANGAS